MCLRACVCECGWYRYWNNIYRPGTKVGFGECRVLYIYTCVCVCVCEYADVSVCGYAKCQRERKPTLLLTSDLPELLSCGWVAREAGWGAPNPGFPLRYTQYILYRHRIYIYIVYYYYYYYYYIPFWRYRKIASAFRYQLLLLLFYILSSRRNTTNTTTTVRSRAHTADTVLLLLYTNVCIGRGAKSLPSRLTFRNNGECII
jgi:hypothetical protein